VLKEIKRKKKKVADLALPRDAPVAVAAADLPACIFDPFIAQCAYDHSEAAPLASVHRHAAGSRRAVTCR